MASQSNQDPQAGKADTTTRQTRSQTQKNASSAAGSDNVKPAAQDFIAKGPQIPEGWSTRIHPRCFVPCLVLTLFLGGILGAMPPKVSREEIDAQMKELNK